MERSDKPTASDRGSCDFSELKSATALVFNLSPTHAPVGVAVPGSLNPSAARWMGRL